MSIRTHEGQSIDGLDMDLVRQSMKGSSFGIKDRARYDALDRARNHKAKAAAEAEPAAPTEEQQVSDKPPEQYTGQHTDKDMSYLGNAKRPKENIYDHKGRDYGAIGTRIANDAMRRADKRDLPELLALQKSVDRNPLYWKSRSDVQTGDYLGDIWNFKTPDYKMPKPLDAVKAPDISGIADKYMDKIDSIKPKL